MKRVVMVTFAACALLAGCSEAAKDAYSTYRDVPVRTLNIDGQTWRVLDRPDLKKVLFSLSLGRSAAEGAREGLTYGLAKNRWRTEAEFRPTAEAYLADKGCSPVGGQYIVPGQFEFDYTC